MANRATWDFIKALALSENLPIDKVELDDRYQVSVSNGVHTYYIEIMKSDSTAVAELNSTHTSQSSKRRGVRLVNTDGDHTLVINSRGEALTRDTLSVAYVSAEKTANTTRAIAQVGASNLAGRKVIEIINTSNVVLYVGSSTVTTTGSTRGRPIKPNGSYSLALGPGVDLYIIAPSSATYVVVEGA